jgi:hypothetical protein
MTGTTMRRFIYFLILISLSIPLLSDFVLPPAEMKTAEDSYSVIESLQPAPNKLVLVSLDWGPSTSAENAPQTQTLLEHLMRKRIPFAVITTYAYAAPFLESVPLAVANKLLQEEPNQRWEYGKDWVNLGFQPGGAIVVQSIAKASDLKEVLKTDAKGTELSEIPCMKDIKTIRDIALLAQITGLVGTFNTWIQFFQAEGYRPDVIHGCTSITIPEAYIYYVTGQIRGLYEGVAGAAWYDSLLSKRYPNRVPTEAPKINTSLATAHLVILGLIIVGNIQSLYERLRRKNG